MLVFSLWFFRCVFFLFFVSSRFVFFFTLFVFFSRLYFGLTFVFSLVLSFVHPLGCVFSLWDGWFGFVFVCVGLVWFGSVLDCYFGFGFGPGFGFGLRFRDASFWFGVSVCIFFPFQLDSFNFFVPVTCHLVSPPPVRLKLFVCFVGFWRCRIASLISPRALVLSRWKRRSLRRSASTVKMLTESSRTWWR